MLGVSTGQLLVILGACSVMMKPSDMIKMARVAGRMTGRAVGRLMMYRRQMDDIFEQTAAKKINSDLQDAMSKLQSIGYEVQNLSRLTPGQFIKRQHNAEGTAEAGAYDGSATKPEEFRDEIRNMIRDEIESFCRKSPDLFSRRLDNPDTVQNSAEARKFDVADRSTMVTSKDMELANTGSTNLHSQAMMYARLSESPGIKMNSSTSASYGEQFKESNGLLNVLPISAESAGLLPSRTEVLVDDQDGYPNPNSTSPMQIQIILIQIHIHSKVNKDIHIYPNQQGEVKIEFDELYKEHQMQVRIGPGAPVHSPTHLNSDELTENGGIPSFDQFTMEPSPSTRSRPWISLYSLFPTAPPRQALPRGC